MRASRRVKFHEDTCFKSVFSNLPLCTYRCDLHDLHWKWCNDACCLGSWGLYVAWISKYQQGSQKVSQCLIPPQTTSWCTQETYIFFEWKSRSVSVYDSLQLSLCGKWTKSTKIQTFRFFEFPMIFDMGKFHRDLFPPVGYHPQMVVEK